MSNYDERTYNARMKFMNSFSPNLRSISNGQNNYQNNNTSKEQNNNKNCNQYSNQNPKFEKTQSQNSFQKRSNQVQSYNKRNSDNYIIAHQNSQKKQVLMRKIPIDHTGDHTIRNILGFLAIILVFFLIVDVKLEYENRIQKQQTNIAKCVKKYEQNSCHEPLQAMIERCKQIQDCMSRDPYNQIKYSQIFAFCLGNTVNTLFKTIGLIGVIAIVGIVIALSFRKKHHIEEQIHRFH